MYRLKYNCHNLDEQYLSRTIFADNAASRHIGCVVYTTNPRILFDTQENSWGVLCCGNNHLISGLTTDTSHPLSCAKEITSSILLIAH